MEDDQWGDIIKLSKLIAKKNGRKPDRARLSDVMDKRTDEDRLELLFQREFIRDVREDFEDEWRR